MELLGFFLTSIKAVNHPRGDVGPALAKSPQKLAIKRESAVPSIQNILKEQVRREL